MNGVKCVSRHPEPRDGHECVFLSLLLRCQCVLQCDIPDRCRVPTAVDQCVKKLSKFLFLLIYKARRPRLCLMDAGRSDVLVVSSDYKSKCGLRWYILHLRDQRVARNQNAVPNVVLVYT